MGRNRNNAVGGAIKDQGDLDLDHGIYSILITISRTQPFFLKPAARIFKENGFVLLIRDADPHLMSFSWLIRIYIGEKTNAPYIRSGRKQRGIFGNTISNTRMEKNKQEKKRYRPYPIRMDERTIARLKKEKIKSGLSWNLFMCELINNFNKDNG